MKLFQHRQTPQEQIRYYQQLLTLIRAGYSQRRSAEFCERQIQYFRMELTHGVNR